MIVAPGFIDVHTHVEGSLAENPNADISINMGVTSDNVNPRNSDRRDQPFIRSRVVKLASRASSVTSCFCLALRIIFASL